MPQHYLCSDPVPHLSTLHQLTTAYGAASSRHNEASPFWLAEPAMLHVFLPLKGSDMMV